MDDFWYVFDVLIRGACVHMFVHACGRVCMRAVSSATCTLDDVQLG
jgi:hypothetical protein